MKITSTLLENGLINIHIPIAMKKRGGRKVIISPDNALPVFTAQEQHDHSLIKALVRAYKWRKLYETGKYKSHELLAEKLGVNKSYFARVIRVNLLAPDIKEAILDGRQPRTLMVADIFKPFPDVWEEQRKLFGFA